MKLLVFVWVPHCGDNEVPPESSMQPNSTADMKPQLCSTTEHKESQSSLFVNTFSPHSKVWLLMWLTQLCGTFINKSIMNGGASHWPRCSLRLYAQHSIASHRPVFSSAPFIPLPSHLSNGEQNSARLLVLLPQTLSGSRVSHFIIDFHLRVKEPRCHLLADCTF